MNQKIYQIIAREIVPGGAEYLRTLHTTKTVAVHHAMIGVVTKIKNNSDPRCQNQRKTKRLRILAIDSPSQWLLLSEPQRALCADGTQFSSVAAAAAALEVKPQAIYAAFQAARRRDPKTHKPAASISGLLLEYID